MSHCWLAVLLFSVVAYGQATPPATTPPNPANPAQSATSAKPPATTQQPKAATPGDVPPTAPVITLVGMCTVKPGVPKPADCKTVVTRAQFEKLMKALNPQMPMSVRQQLATVLARTMVAAHEAEKMGLVNRPETAELIHYARNQALAQALLLNLQDKFSHSSPEEIQKYYNDNKAQFEEATLKRIYIPKPRAEAGKTVDENAVKATAEKIQKEAAAGADFDKLQKEAFQAAGIDATPPPTSLGTVKLINMPEMHKSVFNLKPGEVSQIIPDSSGYYVYKLESKQMVPIDQAKESIEKTLQAQKMEKALTDMSNSVKPELNPAYFGPGANIPTAEPGAARRVPPPQKNAAPAQSTGAAPKATTPPTGAGKQPQQ